MLSERSPAEAFPPGEFIREELEARGWRQADLAEILGRPLPNINAILSGKTGISPETARGLADAFGTSAELWLNLDAIYQLSRLREPGNGVARKARLYDKAPVREMIKRKWIEPSNNVEVLEQRVLEFLGIDNLDEDVKPWPHAARRSTSYETIPSELVAWLIRARNLGEAVKAKNFTSRNISPLLKELRLLLLDREEIRKAPGLLADAGIRFIVIEPLAKTRIDGACLWLDKNVPVIALSLRYDRIDAFWHTLMHELAHVWRGDGFKDNAPIDVDLLGKKLVAEEPEFEKRANEFATDALIPPEVLEDFMVRVRPLYSTKRILGFANRLRIHPGIVIGQLQFRNEISYAHSRKFLEPVKDIVVQSALTDGWGHEPVAKGRGC